MIRIITTDGTGISIGDDITTEGLERIVESLTPIERHVITARLQTILNFIDPIPVRSYRRMAGQDYTGRGGN